MTLNTSVSFLENDLQLYKLGPVGEGKKYTLAQTKTEIGEIEIVRCYSNRG